MSKEETSIKGWFNLVVLKEFLTVRVEIDLNYIDLHPSNIALFGWKIEEPLVINVEINEAKLLNIPNEDSIKNIGFVEML